MALDPEQFKHRRQARKAQREKAQKKLILGLIAAGVVLVLCGVGIAVFAIGSSQNGPSSTEPSVPSVPDSSVPDSSVPDSSVPDSSTPEESAPSETLPPSTVVHFVAGGDLNVTDGVVASGGSTLDYSHTFLDVAHLLADGDLAAVNLEGNLCGAPYGSSASAPQAMMQSLSRAGVDMIQLANSYSINRGISGLLSTIDGVRQAGMEPVGVFSNPQEFAKKKGFSLFEVNGVRIAVVAFTKGMDGTTLPPGNESCVNVLYLDYDSVYQKVDKVKIRSVLAEVQAAQPDITIALLHWGSEFNDTISKSQKSICTLMEENGVDAIIGTHPHYVQAIQHNPETGFFVAYSLGDFLGDAARAGSEYSILLDLEITKNNETGEASITGYTYTPLFSVVEEGKPTRVVRIHEAVAAYEAKHMNSVSADTYKRMLYALERIEARVAGK